MSNVRPHSAESVEPLAKIANAFAADALPRKLLVDPVRNQLPMIRCNDISYRQGFVEVTASIHSKHVNLEIWNVHPDQDISRLSRVNQLVSDKEIVGNTEIELSVSQAETLIEVLRKAVHVAMHGEA
jgi:hypothetical protein